MSDAPSARDTDAWHPRDIRAAIVSAARELAENDIPIPPLAFYERLGARAEAIALEAISEAIHSRHDANALANIAIARRAVDVAPDALISASQAAADATLARLVAYLLLTGTDGYNALEWHDAWGGHSDPDWGTMWGIKQDIRDLTPALVFRVCHKGDTRLLGVEIHAPARRLPDDLHARLKARTMMLSGVPILAFSPAEIEADAEDCVRDISSALSILAQELLALHNIDQPPVRDFRPRD
jgi:hypothetical protein